MSEQEDESGEVCEPDGKLDSWTRVVSGFVLLGVVLVDMLGLWLKSPPYWFLGVLLLLALGVEIKNVRKIVVDIMQKQFSKKL